MTTAGDKQIIVSRAQRAAGRAGPAGRPDRGAALPRGLRRRAGRAADHREPSRSRHRHADRLTPEPVGSRADPPPSRRAPSPTPSSSPAPAPTGNNRPLPGAADGAAERRRRHGRPSPGKGTPPDKAIDWQPTRGRTRPTSPPSPAPTRTSSATSPTSRCSPATHEGTEKYLLGPTLIEGNQLTSAIAGVPQNDVQLGRQPGVQRRRRGGLREGHPRDRQRTDPQNRFAIVLDGESSRRRR